VWVIHPALFADQFEEPDFDQTSDWVPWYFGLKRADRKYLWEVIKRPGGNQVSSDYIHCRRHLEFDGVQIYLAPANGFPQWGERWPDGYDSLGFRQFQVSAGVLSAEFVARSGCRDRPGYGPGGNPSREGRD